MAKTLRITKAEKPLYFTLLKKVRTLIKRGWCKYTSAEDKYHEHLTWRDPNATHFCIFGACCKIANAKNETYLEFEKKSRQAIKYN